MAPKFYVEFRPYTDGEDAGPALHPDVVEAINLESKSYLATQRTRGVRGRGNDQRNRRQGPPDYYPMRFDVAASDLRPGRFNSEGFS